MTPPASAVSRAERLVALFCPLHDFGAIHAIDAVDVPSPQRELLDHRSHMTVAMERFHGQPVTLEVVAVRPPSGMESGYSREIVLLDGQSRRVQYGIVRIDLNLVPQAVADRIRAADTPLGRVLVDAGCLCDVQHVELLDIRNGPHLAAVIGPGRTFGRVATIAVGGRPAVELLEVVVGNFLPRGQRS